MAMMERPRDESVRAATASAPEPTHTAEKAPPVLMVPVAEQTTAHPASVVESPATVAEASVGSTTPSTTAASPQTVPAVAQAKPRTWLSAQEKREASMFAELYSILVATEHLEGAFVRGAVSNQDYERNCTQLLTQFKTLQNGLKDKCPDIRAFAQEHGLRCPLAEERLLKTGVAATTLFGGATSSSGKESLACFKASEGFITLSDALKLDMKAADELMPLVRDLQASIVSIPNRPHLAGLDRIAGWLVTLNGMSASDHLRDDQCRQLALDVEQAYTSLKTWLQEKT